MTEQNSNYGSRSLPSILKFVNDYCGNTVDSEFRVDLFKSLSFKTIK